MFYQPNTPEQNKNYYNTEEYKLWQKMANIDINNVKVEYIFVYQKTSEIV